MQQQCLLDEMLEKALRQCPAITEEQTALHMQRFSDEAPGHPNPPAILQRLIKVTRGFHVSLASQLVCEGTKLGTRQTNETPFTLDWHLLRCLVRFSDSFPMKGWVSETQQVA